MNIKITDKDLQATEAIKDYLAKKMERLVKYLGDNFDVQATIKTEGNEQIAEVHVVVGGKRFVAISEQQDLYASIDEVIDILERQVRKYKEKRNDQNINETIRINNEIQSIEEDEVEDEIIKTTYYSIEPMSEEDAKLKLEDRPKDKFMAFINIETQKVNVIYRLKDGKNFGISEPEK